ncbi:hypothetical protein [Marinilabilia salmonicolor]|jgi:hypothetical protein|uniref:Hpr(Ser) kinase/phosphatase n=1 Tax=Marinilabilia salmonicolor TaxID=989 RepID=A0A2T0XP15_9BACT|nr:hypothetical protein [Marinilabilia salmonicolor]PRZ00679.1 hypothetical protein BY457_105195 [Marinilabilia salmonicolor]RCW30807.1 hypothetical protein DFO77_12025 [Marinilabilia salmonicolor]
MREESKNTEGIVIFLPGLKLDFSCTSADVKLVPLGSSLFNDSLTEGNQLFHVSYSTTESVDTSGFSRALSGESFPGAEIPYTWTILRKDHQVGIHIDFDDDLQLEEVFGVIDFSQNTISAALVPGDGVQEISIDPLFQPFGSVLMVVLAHYQDDVLVHASGVLENVKGRLFTAVSGTGKSTMAGIWKSEGATVINDDRLWLRKIGDRWYMFNTPMPYYAQKPLMAPLNEIFLIRQSPDNEVTKLAGINAAMRFMANGIQHFYDKEMTGRHLDRILDIASQVPIYDCGFKLSNDIVREIKGLRD